MSFNIEITALYASLLAILLVLLSFSVIRMRFKHKVGIGDGQITEVSQAIRVHGNFTEYMPLALILLASYELGGGDDMWLHVFGITLVVGRLLHATGLMKSTGTSKPRVLGTLATFIMLIALSVLNIINFVS